MKTIEEERPYGSDLDDQFFNLESERAVEEIEDPGEKSVVVNKPRRDLYLDLVDGRPVW